MTKCIECKDNEEVDCTNTKKRFIMISLVMVILSATIIASPLPFRFYPTHRIVKEVNCISCHVEELRDLDLGIHIRQMNTAQSRFLNDYLSIYGNGSEPVDSLVGPCYSCHVTYGNFKKFGLTDPYIYQVGNYAYSIGNIAVSDSIIDAQYGTIIEWPNNIGNKAIDYFGIGNAAIEVELELLNVWPSNSAVNSEIKIILSNYSGQQVGSAVCNCTAILSPGDMQVINVDNLANDYFSIVVLLDGVWSNATLKLNVSGTDRGTQSFTINAGGPSTIYYVPKDFTGINYLKTNGSYRAVRLDVVWDVWRNYSVNGKITSSDTIWVNATSGWIESNTCSAPDAMCHINQKTTYMGLSDGMGRLGSLYTHQMEIVTSKQCKLCHLRYRNIDAVILSQTGSITSPTTGQTSNQTYPAGTYYIVPGGVPLNMQGYLGNTVCANCGHHNPIPSNWIPAW